MPATTFKADQLDGVTVQNVMDHHTDVTGAYEVEIQTDRHRGIIWVNINGICLLRVCRIRTLKIDGQVLMANQEYPR